VRNALNVQLLAKTARENRLIFDSNNFKILFTTGPKTVHSLQFKFLILYENKNLNRKNKDKY